MLHFDIAMTAVNFRAFKQAAKFGFTFMVIHLIYVWNIYGIQSLAGTKDIHNQIMKSIDRRGEC